MDHLERKIDRNYEELTSLREEMRVEFARLPHSYVPRSEMSALKREAAAARRWAIGLGVPSIIGIVGILVTVL